MYVDTFDYSVFHSSYINRSRLKNECIEFFLKKDILKCFVSLCICSKLSNLEIYKKYIVYNGKL